MSQLGVPVVVLERAPALRQEGSAVSLWANAWRGLDALGVSDQLRKDCLLLERYATPAAPRSDMHACSISMSV
jgi:2-polyprenyl-6-methoxyphenol hydroxylase-like FAD-dependent oxidoreductase